MPIGLHIARNHGKIPIVKAMFPNETSNLKGRPGYLILRIPQKMKTDQLLISLKNPPMGTEQILLQGKQGTFPAKP